VAKPKAATPTAATPTAATPTAATPTDTPMTIEELNRAALALSRKGKGDAVRATLTSLGVTRISLLTGDELGAFQRFIKDMGQ
jgi:hypothetical protein